MPTAQIVVGSGEHADPWHDFAATGAALQRVLTGGGFDTTVTSHVTTDLAPPISAELIVLDIGRPSPPGPDEAAVRAGLLRHLADGGGLLALHVSSTSLPGVPEWEDVLGGIWVRGETFHPAHQPGLVRVLQGHDATAGVDDFVVSDEFYRGLRVGASSTVLATHRVGGHEQPLAWASERFGGRVVYDALGHDAASIAAPGHARLLLAAAHWCVRRSDAAARPEATACQTTTPRERTIA